MEKKSWETSSFFDRKEFLKNMGRRAKGEGTIFKRSDGRWCAAYYDAKLKRHYVYGKTQTEVKKKLKLKMKEEEEKVLEENALIERKMLVQEWVLYFLDNYKKNEIKETTYHAYMELYRKHIKDSDIGKCVIGAITCDGLQRYYNEKKEMGYNPKTIKHIYTLLNSALKKAVQTKLISENVNELVVLPKKEVYQAKTLSAEEVNLIIKNAKDDRLYPIVVLAIYTGLRKGEVMALKWKNIDFEKGELHVEGSLCKVPGKVDDKGIRHYDYKILEPKTVKSKRVVPLLPMAIEALQMQKKYQEEDRRKYKEIYMDEDYVFAQYDGRYLNQRGFMDEYHAFLKRYGVTDVRFHDLRHTFASLLLELGESAKVIQEILGHSTISTTLDIYSHITNSRKVSILQKLDNLVNKSE